MNVLRISAKRAGFRRCGVAHPAEAVDHPAGTFTEKQAQVLKADPMLVVQEVAAPESKEPAPAKKPDPEKKPAPAKKPDPEEKPDPEKKPDPGKKPEPEKKPAAGKKNT